MRDPLGVVSLPFSTGAALRSGLTLFNLTWRRVLALALLFSLPSTLIAYALKGVSEKVAQRGSNLFDNVVGLIGALACIALFIAAAEGRSLTTGQALREATARWGVVMVARIRSGLWILLFTLLLVIPGVWQAVMLAFTTTATVRLSVGDPLDVSKKLVRERWWEVFGFLLVSGVLVYVPVILAAALMEQAVELLTFEPILADLLADWLALAASQLHSAMMLSAFYGLFAARGERLEPMRWYSAEQG